MSLAVKTVVSCHVIFQPVITIDQTAKEFNYIVILQQILTVMNSNRTMESTRMSHFHRFVRNFSLFLLL